VFDRIDGRALAVAAGVLTVVSAAALGFGARVRWVAGRLGAIVVAVISAAMNVLAGIGGPPIAMYTLNADWPSSALRATLQAYFLGLNVIAVIVLGLPDLSPLPWLGLVVGWIAGLAILKRIPDGVVRPLVLLLAGVGGVLAITRGRA
jgi:hypothetical protein